MTRLAKFKRIELAKTQQIYDFFRIIFPKAMYRECLNQSEGRVYERHQTPVKHTLAKTCFDFRRHLITQSRDGGDRRIKRALIFSSIQPLKEESVMMVGPSTSVPRCGRPKFFSLSHFACPRAPDKWRRHYLALRMGREVNQMSAVVPTSTQVRKPIHSSSRTREDQAAHLTGWNSSLSPLRANTPRYALRRRSRRGRKTEKCYTHANRRSFGKIFILRWMRRISNEYPKREFLFCAQPLKWSSLPAGDLEIEKFVKIYAWIALEKIRRRRICAMGSSNI